MPRRGDTRVAREARAKQLAQQELGMLPVPVERGGELLDLVRGTNGLTDETTWQALAEFVAREYGAGTEHLGQTLKQLTDCAKMQLLIRSLRRKEGGSLEAERLAAFQALMHEVYSGVAEENDAG